MECVFFPYKFSARDFLAEKQLKNPIDKLQGSFLKRILGVHVRTCNWAVKSETNRNSILIKIIKRMIGFWSHIKESESPITQDTLKLANKIHNKGNTSWFTSIVKIAEIVGINQDTLGESKNCIDQARKKQLEKTWYIDKEKYSQGKLKLYTSFKELPGFENYLNESNPKLHHAITKIKISAHKFPIETGRFENKNQTDRICPFCREGIRNELHYLIECKNKAITKTRSKFLKPFYNRWKGIQKLSPEEFCKAILACQNDDMITETGILCLKIQETYQNEAL